MTFKAGESGNPSGRPKGSRNKQTLAVIDRLEALGCDLIEGMAMIPMDESANLSIRAQMFEEKSILMEALHSENLDTWVVSIAIRQAQGNQWQLESAWA
jgi:uncharacterized protein DUF5681